MIFLSGIPGVFLLQRDGVELVLPVENQRVGGVSEVFLHALSQHFGVSK